MIFELYNKEDLTEIMCHHKQVAEDYKRLRDSLIDLIRQIKSGKDVSIIETSLKECLHDYSILGQYSMPTNQKDYQNAQQNLGLTGDSETFTWTPEEIDRLLPHELRG